VATGKKFVKVTISKNREGRKKVKSEFVMSASAGKKSGKHKKKPKIHDL